MKKVCSMLFILAFFSCDEKEAELTSIEKSLLGDWLVVSYKNKLDNYSLQENEDGVMSDWGFRWVSELEINKDRTIGINQWHANLPRPAHGS